MLKDATSQSGSTNLAVDIRGLTLGYGAEPVISDVDLQVASRQICAVLGPSGSGKTTLLRAIAGFIRPLAGEIHLDGICVSGSGVDVPPERRGIGLVPQEGALFPHLDVAGNVGFGLPRRTKQERLAAKERIAELLEFVDLAGLEKLQPHELSGGMQQRVALARALARRPRTVLLDEPFSSLDARLRQDLRVEVRELLLQAGASAILVTHDEDEARDMAGQTYFVGPTPVRAFAVDETESRPTNGE